MKRSARLIIAGAILIGIILALAACAPGEAPESPGYVSGDGTVTVFDVGGEPLELTGTSFQGEPVDLAEFRGQVVLLNTWYASCPPCRAEAPDLVALDAREDVQLIGINSRDDAGTAEAFERTFEVQYPSIDDADGSAIAALQGVVAVNAVPTTLVVDPQGRIFARIIGTAEASTLETLIADAQAAP